MSPSTKVDRKAKEILESGGVSPDKTGGRALYFKVRGDSATHQVSFEPGKAEWKCDCTYLSLHPKGECSHILACRLFLERSRA